MTPLPPRYVRAFGDAIALKPAEGSKLTVAHLHITTAPGKILTIPARADAPGVTGTHIEAS